LGDWLRVHDYIPDQIISSSSQRTRETCAGLQLDVTADFTPRLYHAGPDDMHDELTQATGRTVLMLGHNPGIAWFAEMLVEQPPSHARFHDYPTCATLVADFPIDDWAQIQMGTAQVADFITPRELTG